MGGRLGADSCLILLTVGRSAEYGRRKRGVNMTNYEWLKSLSINDLTSYLFDDKGFKEWLEQEHKEEIEPCPVCKCEMSTIWQHGGYYLVCKECGLRFGLDTDMAGRGLIEGEYMDKAALIADWNRRFDDEHE
jgi:hypothetical protein